MKYTVIAWIESQMEWDGEPFAADLGERPRFAEVIRPKALIWRKGEDKEAAENYAATMDHEAKVFVLDSETPLEDAREAVSAR